MAEADDDAVDMRLATGFVAPSEGAVGEEDFEAVFSKEQVPEDGDLFALGQAVGGDKGAAYRGVRGVFGGFQIPRGDVIEVAGVAKFTEHFGHVFALRGCLVMFPDEWRIAHDVGTVFGGEDAVPVEGQGVAVDDGGAGFQGDANEEFSKRFRESHVDLVVGQPQGGFGDAHWEFFQFDSVKLVNVDAGNVADFEVEGELLAMQGVENVEFEEAQFAVGDDKEVATAAGGVEDVLGGGFALSVG